MIILMPYRKIQHYFFQPKEGREEVIARFKGPALGCGASSSIDLSGFGNSTGTSAQS